MREVQETREAARPLMVPRPPVFEDEEPPAEEPPAEEPAPPAETA